MRAKNWLVFIVIAASSGLCADTSSLDERVSFKKLAAYWQEKEYERARESTEAFLKKYPTSKDCSQLQAMLGDLYFSEKNYAVAVSFYERISDIAYAKKTAFHYLHSLYQVGLYETFIGRSGDLLNDPAATPEDLSIFLFELAEIHFHKKNHEKALFYYEKLQDTPLSHLTLLPRALCYTACGKSSQAAAIYLELARLYPAQAEDFLFQAASLQMQEDTLAALDTFQRIIDLQGKYRGKASYNLLVILFQEGQYRAFVERAQSLLGYVPENKQAFVRYYLGCAFFKSGAFQEAAQALESLSDEKALWARICCAQHLNDLALCIAAVESLQALKAPKQGDGLQVQLDLSKKNGDYPLAIRSIDAMCALPLEYSKKEILLYDKTVLLMQAGQVKEAMDAIDFFLQSYPQSAYKKRALNNGIALCREDDPRKITALKCALDAQGLFSAEENQIHRLLLCKTLVGLKQEEEALGFLNAYIRDFPSQAEAYLLLAHCYKESDDRLFIASCEQALCLNPLLQQKEALHKLLFNAYLRSAQTAPSDEKPHFIAKGADHLFALPMKSVSFENQRWLASYYLTETRSPDKALVVLEQLVQAAQQNYTPENEAEVIQLAGLYTTLKQEDKALHLLEPLVQVQASAPSLNWRYHRRSAFELAGIYVRLGLHKKAVVLYEDLIASSSQGVSYFALAAKLELIKIQILGLSDADLTEENPNIQALCDQLKEIEVLWQPCSESLHVEAGLAYVFLKTQTVPSEHKQEKEALLLEHLKEAILAQTQDLSRIRDYLAQTRSCLSDRLRELLESAVADTLNTSGVEDRQLL